jgi:hypothetical protein
MIYDWALVLGCWIEWGVLGRPRSVGIDSSVSTYSFTNYYSMYLSLPRPTNIEYVSKYHTTLKYLST